MATNLPSVSIIVPMRNERKHIARCLESVVKQDYPKDLMEVLVVDGMSQDSSRKIVEDFIEKLAIYDIGVFLFLTPKSMVENLNYLWRNDYRAYVRMMPLYILSAWCGWLVGRTEFRLSKQ